MTTIDKPKILVVNDDPASLLALTSLLDQWADESGYSVLSARSGQEALRQVLLHDFAVILLDVNMPGMDGFETAEAIHQRARSADIPIIFVTAFLADEIDRLKAYQRGAADFLFTPVIPQILHAKVQVFVALATKNEELKRQAHKLSQRTTELTATNKRLTREMEERQAAEAKSHAKDEFLAMLGHELRNPLSAISSAASLIGLPGAPTDTVTRAKLIIQRQSQHLSRIVDDLLDLSRAMSGKILLDKQHLDLAALVSACLDTFKATGRTGNYLVNIDMQAGWVDGDPTRLEQIATNLIDNALKYTPPGGTIDIAVSDTGQDIVLEVRDTGVGISAELLPHVFDVFVQGSITLDRAQGGLGIGLALVRRLVELHGGKVSAHSEGASAGSTFVIRLPRAAPAAVPASAAPSTLAQDCKPAILLIEDNDDGREMMATMLDAYGYPVRQAADGVQGVQMARSFLPDVALVDIGLPGIDGYEVARRLRQGSDTCHIKLIALTGYGLADDQRRVLEAGFDKHLVKPVEIADLLDAIGQCAATADE
ncbi:response regulator [Massilia antarctica]|uniref:response regulator n=1 Tax=Massilia antarctica TaxID=2765360 RepID=UPI0006BB7BAB|nr:response regulator [Massilia sp. H27-R4]CUI09081.1 Chemotaxis protein methyltransferase CheR [Janthinobacterium sp. CG23_2]CUU32867.1 Chemotaxis protein methyltransferase CheR [Janthinobacterium sp. CG23_2]